jgi:carboxylate-amine ligase
MDGDGFRGGSGRTLGVELELQLLDAGSYSLRPAIEGLLESLPAGLREWVSPEFHRCCAEVKSGVARTVDEVGADLLSKLERLAAHTEALGLRLGWGGTHPVDSWEDQPVTSEPRYVRLSGELRDTIHRQLTFGLHVHVGVPDGEAAIRTCDALRAELPVLLAMSANSPFWCGRVTGLQSYRAEVMTALPTGGMPPHFGAWRSYGETVEGLVAGGSIDSPKDLWWDVRPSPAFGTVEVRVCDMPRDLEHTLVLVALVQCLVQAAVAGDPIPCPGPAGEIVIRQNRWRAARHGLDAELIDPGGGEPITARRRVRERVDDLAPVAEALGCAPWLRRAGLMAWQPTAAERLLAWYRRHGSLEAVAREALVPSDLAWGRTATDGDGSAPGAEGGGRGSEATRLGWPGPSLGPGSDGRSVPLPR